MVLSSDIKDNTAEGVKQLGAEKNLSEEVRGCWRKPHNESFPICIPHHILFVRITKPGRLRWVGHVACTGRTETYTGFWWGNTEEATWEA